MTNGQLQDAAAFNDVIVAYRNGAPVRVRDVGRAIDDVQNNRMAAWYNDKRGIVLAIQRQPGTNTVQVVDEIRKLLPQFRAQIPPGIDVEVLYDRSAVHPRFGARRAVHPGAGAGAGDHGDLPVPAQPLGHPHSGSGAAHVHHRHVLGDVPVRLQRGHPVAAGAHAVRGLRGGRRHRHAGEHRAPPGDGQDPAAGHARGLARDRLHHPVHDAVAGGGVRAGAVHGGRDRPAAARVRRHHHGRHPDLRLRQPELDADAVRALAAARTRAAPRPSVPGERARLRRGARPLRPHLARDARLPARDHRRVRRNHGRWRSTWASPSPRASSPPRTWGRCSPSPRGRRTSPSTPCTSNSSWPWPRSGRIRTSHRPCRSSAWAAPASR